MLQICHANAWGPDVARNNAPKTIVIDRWRARVKAARGKHEDGRWYWEARGPGEDGGRTWRALGWRTREEATADLFALSSATPAPTLASSSAISTVQDLLETWLGAQRERVQAGELRESSRGTYQEVCERLLVSVARFGAEPAAKITSVRLEDLYLTLRGLGWAPRSALQTLEVVSSAARWAMRREYLPLRDLRASIGTPARVRERNTPAVDTVARLLAAVEEHGPAWARPFLSVQASTGMRPGEVSVLRPCDLSVPARKGAACPIITIPDVPGKTKTGTRQVALSWWAYDALQTIAPASPESRFFGPNTSCLINDYLARACEAEGLPRMTAMSFRRYVATQHAVLGHNVAEAARAMGHSVAHMTGTYYTTTPETLRSVGIPDPTQAGEVVDLAARRRRG